MIDNGMVLGVIKVSSDATIPEAIVAAAIILAVGYVFGRIVG